MIRNEDMFPFELRMMNEAQLQLAHELELACYPAEAAASREAFAFRINHFPRYFLGAWQGETLIGLACGVRTVASSCQSDDVKQAHGGELEGPHLCVLSVAVSGESRRQGVGKALMKALIRQAEADGLHTVILMCEEHLIPFYEQLGFQYEALSTSQHGGLQWHEMKLQLV